MPKTPHENGTFLLVQIFIYSWDGLWEFPWVETSWGLGGFRNQFLDVQFPTVGSVVSLREAKWWASAGEAWELLKKYRPGRAWLVGTKGGLESFCRGEVIRWRWILLCCFRSNKVGLSETWGIVLICMAIDSGTIMVNIDELRNFWIFWGFATILRQITSSPFFSWQIRLRPEADNEAMPQHSLYGWGANSLEPLHIGTEVCCTNLLFQSEWAQQFVVELWNSQNVQSDLVHDYSIL